MPPQMLARHLWIKAWRRREKPPAESGQAG
jgi:hypothetical protein